MTVQATIAVAVTAPPANAGTMTLTPTTQSLSVVQGNSGSASLSLASQNGITGTATIQPHCLGVSACTMGFTYNYATSVSLPANGTVPLSMTFNTVVTTVPGVYNYDYQVSLNGKAVVATIAVTVTAKPSDRAPAQSLS